MLHLADRTFAPPARGRDLVPRAAIGAEPPARVPVHQRLCRREHARFFRRHEPARRDRAQVDQFEVVAAGDDENPTVKKAVARVGLLLDRLVADEGGEDWRAFGRDAEQRLDLRPAEPFDLAHRQQRLEPRAGLEEHRHVARDDNRARIAPGAQARHLVGVLAPVGEAIERIGGEAESLQRRQRRGRRPAAQG